MGLADFFGIGKAAADTATSLTSGIVDIVTVAKGDIPPAAKAEIRKLEIAGQNKINELVQQSVDKAREFALQYEGRADQIPKWLLVVRSVIRPLITLLTFGWFMAALSIDLYNGAFKNVPDYVWILNKLPQGFWWILGIIITFWFGGKVGERIVEKLKIE